MITTQSEKHDRMACEMVCDTTLHLAAAPGAIERDCHTTSKAFPVPQPAVHSQKAIKGEGPSGYCGICSGDTSPSPSPFPLISFLLPLPLPLPAPPFPLSFLFPFTLHFPFPLSPFPFSFPLSTFPFLFPFPIPFFFHFLFFPLSFSFPLSFAHWLRNKDMLLLDQHLDSV